jgi:hypothetical protein
VWLHVLKFFVDDAVFLIGLQTSNVLPNVIRRVAGDIDLWKDISVKHPVTRGQLRTVVPRLGPRTKSITVRSVRGKKAKKGRDGFLLSSFFSSVRLRCSRVTSIRLENLDIDAHCNVVANLPKSVELLSLCGTNFDSLPRTRCITSSPFYKLHKVLPKLKVVKLTGNSRWLTKGDLDQLKKSPLQLNISLL